MKKQDVKKFAKENANGRKQLGAPVEQEVVFKNYLDGYNSHINDAYAWYFGIKEKANKTHLEWSYLVSIEEAQKRAVLEYYQKNIENIGEQLFEIIKEEESKNS